VTADLAPMAGREIATSDWLAVTQAKIDEFAAATNDRQWIHVDAERAKREAPSGRTIAHGFLVVSLLAPLFENTIMVGGTSSSINYGFNKLRFTGPVMSETRIRARFTLAGYDAVQGGAQLTWSVTIEREGEEKPALVAEWLMRRYA
jgi:acyl dehydratase